MTESTDSCLACDYALIGLDSNRCPECGRAFDPNDPKTVRTGRLLSPIERAALTPPGRYFHGACIIAALVSLTAVSVPGTYFLLWMASRALWLVLALIWIIRAASFSFVTVRCFGLRAASNRMNWGKWSVAPIVAATVLILNFFDATLWIRFWLSKSSMDQFSAQVIKLPTTHFQQSRVGLYSVDHYDLIPAGMKFIITGTGFLDPEGFAFCTVPPVNSSDIFQHFWGNWYIVREHW